MVGRVLDISQSCCSVPHNQSSQAPFYLRKECLCIPPPQPSGGWREGATGGRRNLVGLPGFSGIRLPYTSQAPCGSGDRGDGMELSLSSVLGTSVLAEGDFRPWQPWPFSQDTREAFCRIAQSCHREQCSRYVLHLAHLSLCIRLPSMVTIVLNKAFWRLSYPSEVLLNAVVLLRCQSNA